jgi:hypothetical protein
LSIHFGAFIFIVLCDFGHSQNIFKLILNCSENGFKVKEREKKRKA